MSRLDFESAASVPRAMTLLHAVHHACIRNEREDGWYAAQYGEITVEWLELCGVENEYALPETWAAVFRYVRRRLDHLAASRFKESSEPLLIGRQAIDEAGEPIRDASGVPGIAWMLTPQARDLFAQAGNRRARREAMRQRAHRHRRPR